MSTGIQLEVSGMVSFCDGYLSAIRTSCHISLVRHFGTVGLFLCIFVKNPIIIVHRLCGSIQYVWLYPINLIPLKSVQEIWGHTTKTQWGNIPVSYPRQFVLFCGGPDWQIRCVYLGVSDATSSNFLFLFTLREFRFSSLSVFAFFSML